MGISNADKIRAQMQADQNCKRFFNAVKQIEDVSTSSVMLTNIDVMRLNLNKLLESGSIEKNTSQHQQLESIFKDATSIQAKFSKSLEDTAQFYYNCNNFNDIVQRISGDINV